MKPLSKKHQKETVQLLVRVVMSYYFNCNATKEFEDWINTPGDLKKWEQVGVLAYFKKEIYPVDKEIAKWIWGLGREININFYSKLKELKKSGYNLIQK